jgi:hypothetical protein
MKRYARLRAAEGYVVDDPRNPETPPGFVGSPPKRLGRRNLTGDELVAKAKELHLVDAKGKPKPLQLSAEERAPIDDSHVDVALVGEMTRTVNKLISGGAARCDARCEARSEVEAKRKLDAADKHGAQKAEPKSALVKRETKKGAD